MRIVIDLQGAQSESRFRGIGRYALSLALAIVQNAGAHEIWLALNAAFPESILDIRHVFDGLIPQEHIQIFDVPSPAAESDPSNAWRTRTAEKIREHFLRRMNPDVIHVSSLFEGWGDDAVTSIGAFGSGENTTLSLYDVIPLLHQEIYLPDKMRRDFYFRKVQSLRKARLLLAISESSRRETIDALELPEDLIVNISAAIENRFHPIALSEERILQLRRRYSIQRKMIMCAPGGFDVRKNIDGLIGAYALLPSELRAKHQLVIASKIDDGEHARLRQLRRQARLAEDEVVLTGYVSDDDLIALYSLATLFVFPSKHEGFGLPPLEAMACGAPTIGANISSIPEVIDLAEALFDPASMQSIANKMTQVLKDDGLRGQLREHGLQQAKRFSWDISAKRAIAALEAFQSQKKRGKAFITTSTRRPKLAYLSPLPPERSGIADYSAELLPELARHYNIEVIVAQQTMSDPWIDANCPVRSVRWFEQNASRYERILYHFGNSPFHSHMFGLLRQYPGVVVLHDFFLSGVLAHEESTGAIPGAWTNALYHSHGYEALLDRCTESGFTIARERYPCNLEVLQNARGVVVHSDYLKKLTRHWYSQQAADDWVVIPATRSPCLVKNRSAAKNALGINDDFFVVCSFGFVDPTKCTDRLIEAWISSRLGRDHKCVLIFVGENHGGDYGQRLLKMIRRHGFENRILITGWTDTETYSNYLAAADVGVQLHSLSGGETSRALLDCMNNGLATIVNAHGSAEELPSDAVWMLSDEYTDTELVDALETLWQDDVRRSELGRRAQKEIRANHNPRLCADQYAQAIEAMYRRAATDQHALVEDIAALDGQPADDTSLELVAKSIAMSSMPQPSQRQLLVDVSSIARNDLKTGIDRVVSAHLLELIRHPPEGFRIEPVYLSDQVVESNYRYARSYACKKLGIENVHLSDAPIDIGPGDILYVADFCSSKLIEAAKSNVYLRWRAAGIPINVLIYDMLPILRPEFFPEGLGVTHEAWLKTIAESASRLICISNAVADDLRLWLTRHPALRKDALMIDVIPLGADITSSVPSSKLPNDSKDVLPHIGVGPILLMVGTIEPRKGYLQTIAAFDRLWKDGLQVNLLIVGEEGWTRLPYGERCTIREIVDRLRRHPEVGKRLCWLGGIPDDSLLKIYGQVDALLMASEGEGFGLPLIEAAQHKLPIVARDIPVFREVAGEHAFYFSGEAPEDLAAAIKEWLDLYARGKAPGSDHMPWITWKESARQLIDVILDK